MTQPRKDLDRFNAEIAAASLGLLAARVQKNLKAPWPAAVIPRNEAGPWCLVPTPTVEIRRVRLRRRPGKSPIRSHTLEQQMAPETRHQWKAMCKEHRRIETRIAQGHRVSQEDIVFSWLARVAREWSEWVKTLEPNKPAIPPVLVVSKKRAPMWVLTPTEREVRIVIVRQPSQGEPK